MKQLKVLACGIELNVFLIENYPGLVKAIACSQNEGEIQVVLKVNCFLTSQQC